MDAGGCSVEQRVALPDQVVLQPGCWTLRGQGASGVERSSGTAVVRHPGGSSLSSVCSRPPVLGRVLRSRCLSERRVQVIPEIVNMFAADAQAQQPGRHLTLSWELAAPLDGAFDAAQTGGADDDVHGVAEAVSCAGVGHLEGQYCSEAGHL